MPDRLKSLEEEPTSLYISLCAPDKKTYLKVNRPLIQDGWERLNESLELMKSFNCRKVIRLTLVKKLNLKNPEGYAKLILKTDCNFFEVKAFMHVGEAQKRLPREAMPSMEEIKDFARKLSELTGYIIKDEDLASRVVLLSKR
jgi:tRNA wybutosine-synthesizing protein 1